MDHHTIKGYFILVIIIFACIMILCQCDCLQCNLHCKCNRENRIDIEAPPPVEIRDNQIVVIGMPVNVFDMNREGEGHVETIVVDVIH